MLRSEILQQVLHTLYTVGSSENVSKNIMINSFWKQINIVQNKNWKYILSSSKLSYEAN